MHYSSIYTKLVLLECNYSKLFEQYDCPNSKENESHVEKSSLTLLGCGWTTLSQLVLLEDFNAEKNCSSGHCPLATFQEENMYIVNTVKKKTVPKGIAKNSEKKHKLKESISNTILIGRYI